MARTKTEVRPTPAKLNKESLAEFVALEVERRACDSRARAIAKQNAPVQALIAAELEKAGRDSVSRCGFTLMRKLGARYPKWKEAFVARLGFEAAAEIEAATPHSVQVWASPVQSVEAE